MNYLTILLSTFYMIPNKNTMNSIELYFSFLKSCYQNYVFMRMKKAECKRLENHDKSIRHKFSRFKMDKNHFYYVMNIELHHDLN